jgi:hypothetical protein
LSASQLNRCLTPYLRVRKTQIYQRENLIL